MLATLVLFIASALAFATPTYAQPADPPGPLCFTWANQARTELANMTQAQAQAFHDHVPPRCAGTRAQAQARIDALARAAQAQPQPTPPDPCASANAAWPYLRNSTDRGALTSFVANTPAQCGVRTQAQQRLAALVPPTRPNPPVTTPSTTTTATTVASGGHSVGESFHDCADCPEMVVVPAGSFTMGSPAGEPNRQSDEGPQRRITFARNFAVGKYEVTRAQYAAFSRASGRAASNGCYTDRDNNGSWEQDANGTWRDPGFSQGENEPVVCVSWDDARAYVQWLNTQTSGGYRLLSEAEWEYAARGGDRGDPYPWGSVASHEYANYGADQCCHGAASGRDQWQFTSPVGSFPANAFGLNDMHGNVWEWTQDCYASSLDNVPSNGSAYETGSCSLRVYRGGSWSNSPQYLRSALRGRLTPPVRGDYMGFRVARTLN